MPTYKNIDNLKYLKTTNGLIKISSIIPSTISPNYNVLATNINVNDTLILNSVYTDMEYGEEKDVLELSNGNKVSIYRGSNQYTLNFYVGTTLYGYVSITPLTFANNLPFIFFSFWYNITALKTVAVLGYYNNYVQQQYFTIADTANSLYNFDDFLAGSVIDSDDPFSTLTDDNETGGYGDGNYSGDPVDFPTLPAITASNSGFVTLFSPSITEMRDLSAYMWTGLFDLATYRKIFANPMDCILGVGIVPITPDVSPTPQTITVGNISTGLTASRVTSQFFVKDCGTLTVNGVTASNMDFSPYTKAEIYLPFCGTHSISVDDIMNATLSLKYYIDLLTGACTACVKVNKTNSDGSTLNSVLYQFSGNCMNVIPFTSQNLTTTIQAIVGAVATIGATVATGGAGAVGAGAGAKSALAGSMIASEVNNVMNMKPTIMKSGNLTANCGFLATQTPMLILTMPNLCRPSTENEHFGTPYYKSGTLSDFSGYTVIDSVHLENMYCTESERAEIEELLKMGVIV